LNTEQYITNDIAPFDVTTKIQEIQTAFNQLTFSHIPIKKDGLYIGCISENDAHCFDEDKYLTDYLFALDSFFVTKKTNWLDILEAFAVHESNIMPILDKNNKYIGYYELLDIMNIFHDTPFLNETGGIIVVEKTAKDHSFSEISQIIESNEAKILGVFISNIENDIVRTTIKIGHIGMNAIVQTFRRYNYHVVSNHEEDKFLDDLKDRSNYLDKYLNI
jgi:hypothetical protein